MATLAELLIQALESRLLAIVRLLPCVDEVRAWLYLSSQNFDS